MVASRAIQAGETILRESPLLAAPHEEMDARIFMLLPGKALEAVLLLHNAQPGFNQYSSGSDIPYHRLLDNMMCTLNTNAFRGDASYGPVGLLLLTGSLFNTDNAVNVVRTWDEHLMQQVFVAARNVAQGEKLTTQYTIDPEFLRAYGI